MSAGAFQSLGPWTWVILGLALIGLEIAAPGIFLIWLGLAALVTGGLDALFDLSWQAAMLVFAGLSVVAVLLGRKLTHDPKDTSDRPALNRRGQALVGQVFTLETPIVAGEGRLRVGDSSWRIVGADAEAGARIRVVRIEGATLVVEPA